MSDLYKQIITPSLSLFTSLSTLVCCALPALFVALGMGAVLAGLVSNMPWLVVLSENKEIVFCVATFMLILSSLLQWRTRHAPCPADPLKAKACMRMRKISFWVLIFSWVVFSVGGFFAFFGALLA